MGAGQTLWDLALELAAPEGRVDELARPSPRAGNEVHLGDEGALHRQLALEKSEGGVLGPDIDRKAGRSVEAVHLPAWAEGNVGACSTRQVEGGGAQGKGHTGRGT